jgi:hypothetical protein
MKLRSVGILAAVVLMAVVHPLVAQRGSRTTGCSDVNWPSLQPTDAVYPDAVVLTRALTDNGFVVQCIAPSKMAGTFEGQTGAALYRTNRGDFEALFLPKLQNFDGLQIVERQESGRYLYSFGGHPKPWPANLIDASRPVYFIKSLNRLIVAHEEELAAHLGAILTGR